MGIEYLLYEGKALSEQKNVYRLSTTKQLCYEQAKSKIEHVVLFGDIDYTTGGEKPSAEKQRSLDALRAVGGSLDSVIQFTDLGNTRREIEEIASLLLSQHVKNVVPLSDAQASDQTFLSLNDTKVNVLHIATHGAYFVHQGR